MIFKQGTNREFSSTLSSNFCFILDVVFIFLKPLTKQVLRFSSQDTRLIQNLCIRSKKSISNFHQYSSHSPFAQFYRHSCGIYPRCNFCFIVFVLHVMVARFPAGTLINSFDVVVPRSGRGIEEAVKKPTRIQS